MAAPHIETGLYVGDVMHQRFAPKQHRLNYRIFQVLFDLDRLDDDLKQTKCLSRNRFNLYGFYDRDHGPDKATAHTGTLKDRMIRLLAGHGLYENSDRLFLLAMPRILGFVFNPISLYFVQGADGAMKAVVYEVNNTFGDRHSYVLPVRQNVSNQTRRRIHQAADKRLHVSPFMDMDMAYEFELIPPEDSFVLNIRLKQEVRGGRFRDMLFAGFTAKREALRDSALLRHFFAMPLMTLNVVWGIHWEAAILFLKGVRLRPKPPTEKSSASFKSITR
jgi:uncharacterized protein